MRLILLFSAREVPSIEAISGFLELSKIWDFPGLAFKWLFLNQQKSLVPETCNSNPTLAHEYGAVLSA